MKKTYKGSCHCGAVTFEADIDLSKGSYKCNCAICTKTRTWIVPVAPEDFRLKTGESDLNDYKYHDKSANHVFCKKCGVRPFGSKELPGGKRFAVRLNCLDDVPDEELAAVPVTYANGREMDFKNPPAVTKHL